MPNLAELNVLVGADVKPLEQGLNEAKAALSSFANTGSSTLDPLSRSLSNTAQTALKASTDIKSLTATIALLGREQAQVSATNIEGFRAYELAIQEAKVKLQQLRVAQMQEVAAGQAVTVTNVEETATTVGLTGALGGLRAAFGLVRQAAYLLPGIGIAGIFNLAFEAITNAASTMGIFSSKTEEAGTNLNYAKSELSDFEKELQKTVQDQSEYTAKAALLFDALSDSNLSLSERKNIIGELNKISPEYLGSLDKEKASYQDIKTALDAYNKSIGRSSELKALLPGFQKYYEALIQAQIRLTQLQEGRSTEQILSTPEEDAALIAEAQKDVDRAQKIISQAKRGLESIAGGGLNLSEILFGKDVDKVVSAGKTIGDVLEELKQKFALISQQQDIFGNLTQSNEDRIKALNAAINALVNINVPGDSPVIRGLIEQARVLQEEIDKAKLKINLLSTRAGVTAPNAAASTGGTATPLVALTEMGDKANAIIEKNFERAKYLTDKLGSELVQAMANVFENAFIGLGEGIGNLLSGKNNPFEALGQILGQGIKALGAQLIKMGVIAETIKIALKNPFGQTNPFLLIAGGIALEAIGTAISNLGVTAHAEGGIFNKPTLIGSHLFGEKGPEALIPLNRLQSMMGNNGNQAIDVTGKLTMGYNEIAVIIERANRYRTRNYGPQNG